MKVISKRGRVFSDRFAKTAIKIGIGQEVIEEEDTEVKKKGRPKKSK